MSLSESFTIPDVPASENDDVDSLPSTSTESFSSEDDDYDAQREWEQSLEQLQLLLTMILVPFAGKYFGRKFAYWSRSLPWRRVWCWQDGLSVANVILQAGRGIWNGCTTSRYSGRARRRSRPPAP
ncbi:hypothetical protein F4775DRAFT_572955 [Biscogniauxia sp. FL1348]|nr:hypothetical protein F4775DRAFT_572955 [Biscogniauxia sp. FL1348]